MKIQLIIYFVLSLGFIENSQGQIFDWINQTGNSIADGANHGTVDSNGDILCTGFFGGTVDFDPGPGVFNMTATSISKSVYLQKFNSNGGFLWALSIGSLTHSSEGNQVVTDNMNNIYIIGTFQGTMDFDPGPGVHNLTSATGAEIFILKLDASGNFIWVGNTTGGYFNYGHSVCIDGSANIYITGRYTGYVDINPGPDTLLVSSQSGVDSFISKLDSAGNFIWGFPFGGASSAIINNISCDNAGNIYAAGNFNGMVDFDPGPGSFTLNSPFLDDVFLLKLNSSGNFIWAVKFGSSMIDQGFDLAVDVDGMIYVTGFFQDSTDFDPGPATFDIISNGEYDAFVTKLDSSGNFIWARTIGGNFMDTGNNIAWNINQIHLTGLFQGTVDLDPGPGVYFGTADSLLGNMFILTLDTAGNFLEAKSIGGSPAAISGSSVFANPSGEFFVTGWFTNTIDFDQPNSVFLTSNGDWDAFIMKYDPIIISMPELNSTGEMLIYPNPASDILTIKSPSGKLRIFDNMGKLLSVKTLSKWQSEINFYNYPDGIYFLLLEADEKFYSCKLQVLH